MRSSERIYRQMSHDDEITPIYAELNSNSLGKTLRSIAPVSKRFFHSIQERSITKFILGPAYVKRK